MSTETPMPSLLYSTTHDTPSTTSCMLRHILQRRVRPSKSYLACTCFNTAGGKDERKDPPYGADVLRMWVASVDYSSDVMVGQQTGHLTWLSILKQLRVPQVLPAWGVRRDPCHVVA
jgi:hypothetical protein